MYSRENMGFSRGGENRVHISFEMQASLQSGDSVIYLPVIFTGLD